MSEIVERLLGEAEYAESYGFDAMPDAQLYQQAATHITTIEAENAKLRADNAAMVEALTASGDTKAAYMGEFAFQYIQTDDNGDDYATQVYVPWTTIKEIMAAIKARTLLAQHQHGGKSDG